jgi:autotransporter-associated beta strand protein
LVALATPTVQTLSDSHGSYYLVNNGTIQFQLYSTGSLAGKVTSIVYKGQQMVGSKDLYYDIQGTPGIFLGSGETYSVTTGSNYADLTAEHPATATEPLDVTWHFILRDGDSGFSTYLTYHHTTAMADYSSNENRLGAEFFNGNLFHYTSVSDNFWGYQAAGDPARAQGRWITAETEDMRGIPDEYIKNYETKYDWRTTQGGNNGVVGLVTAANTSNATRAPSGTDYGVWNISDYRADESLNAGPTHPQTPVADGASIIPSPAGSHFGGPSLVYTGNMDKAFGPFFTYFNTGANINTMRADATQYSTGAQSTALNNFYDSLNLPYYVPTSGRGTVAGQVRLQDGTSLTGATVILSSFNPTQYAADPIGQEYQRRAAGYNYWVSPSADGTFSLPDVRPGTYRVTVIKPGVYREATWDNITVSAGATTTTPNLTVTPDVHGAGVFQIGSFDRTAGEFRDGNNYNNWLDTFNVPKEFPNGVNYTVNPANPFNDTQNWRNNWPIYQQNAGEDFYKVNFNLASAPAANSTVTVTVSIAAEEFINDLAILVGNNRVDASFDHTADNAPSTYRSGDTSSRVLYRKLSFPASWLHSGSNSVTFHIVGGNMQWDAVRMDITNPGNFFTSQWNGGNGVWSDGTQWQTQTWNYTNINKGTSNLPNDTSTTFADGATPTAPINNSGAQNFYDAVINGGTVALNASTGVQKLSLLQGTLNMAGGTNLTANDTFVWGGATVNGPGTINALTTTTVNLSNTLSGGGKIVSSGAVSWLDSGAVTITGAGSQWTTPGVSFGQTGGGALAVNNGGTFSAGSGSVVVGSQGMVNLNAGTIIAGSINNAGMFSSIGGSINLSSTFTNSGIASIDGGLGGTGVVNSGGAMVLGGVNPYSGSTSITGGVVQFGSAASIGGSGASVTVGSGGAVSYLPGISDPTFLSRLNTSSTGALALTGADAATSLDFTSAPLAPLANMAIGAFGNVTYAGNYTPAGNLYRLGGGGGTLTFAPQITGAAGVNIGNSGTGGAVILNSANSYTGPTSINGGVLSVATLANGGVNSPIGSSSNAASNLILNGGTLQYTGTGSSTDRLLTLGSGGGTLDGSGSSAVNFTNSGPAAITGNGNRTLLLTGSSAAGNAFSPGLSDPASGTTSLTKDGPGNWTLGASPKTYSGDTTVLNGALNLGAGASLPSGSGKGNLVIGVTGTFEMNGQDLSINGLNDGPAGPITPANTNGWSTANGPGGGVLDNNVSTHTLTVGNANAAGLFSGVISGSLNLIKSGTGTQTLTGDNTYSGTTTINAGALVIGIGGTPSSTGPGDGGFRGMLGAGTVTNDSLLIYNRGYFTTAANLITGPGTLKQIANAELVLNGANNYTGPTLIGGGIANIGLGGPNDGTGLAYTGDSSINASVLANGGSASSIGASGSAASNLVLDGGTLFYSSTSPASTNRLFTVTPNGGAIYSSGALNFNGSGAVAMSGAGDRELSLGGDSTSASTFGLSIGDPAGGGITSLTKDRSNTWIIAPSSTLTYTGDTTIDAGVLQLGAGAALPFGPGKGNVIMPFNANVNAGTNYINQLEMGGNNVSINGLTGGSTAVVSNNSGVKTLTIGNNNASGNFSGVLKSSGGSLALTKVGSGTEILSGTSTYTGATSLDGGIINFAALNNLGNNGPIVFGGGTLQYAASNTADISTRPVTMGPGGGAIDTNGNNVTFALSFGGSGAGGLTKIGAGSLTLLGANNNYAGPTTITTDTLIIGNAGALPSGGAVVNNANLNFTGAGTSIAGPITGTGKLTIGATSTVQLAPGNSPSSQSAMTIAPGGMLDMTTGSLTLKYGNGANPNAAVRNYISIAYNASGTLWTGTTGITSTSAAADPAHHSVAFANGGDGEVNGLTAGQELITYAYAGDANLDGKVDFNDFVAISTHFMQPDINWDHGNFNYDGVVDFNDFVVLSTNFGAGVTGVDGVGATPIQLAQYNALAASYGISNSQIAAWDATLATLPEPAGTSLLLLGAAGLLRRSRKRIDAKCCSLW